MKVPTLSLDDLKVQLEAIEESCPSLKDEDLFTVWFLRAYLTDRMEDAQAALCNDPKDKGVDAVLVDDGSRTVFVIQAKYRKDLLNKNENRGDIIGFAEIARLFDGTSKDGIVEFVKDANPTVGKLMNKAYKRVTERSYRLGMYYVTLGKCSPKLRKDADKIFQRSSCDGQLAIIDGTRVMNLLRDYLDGVAPPIPALDLEMERGEGVSVNGIMQRYEKSSEIESWVFSMRGDAVADIFERGGIRLFARNIRGFLGEDTPVNRNMQATLQTEPERFFYYNNGITMLCDEAEKRSAKGKDYLHVGNPQVINGQQTTRVLSMMSKEAAKATVLVKVIKVPRDTGNDGFDALVSSIVGGTNWQNAIRASDLMANDRTQIELEREFRKLRYLYLRKRQGKREAKSDAGGHHFYAVRKEEIAVAVAGCDLDPVVPRSGRDKLFEEDLYNTVFPVTDPRYYLSRYWMMRCVRACSRGKPEWGYAQWLVLGFVWPYMSPLLKKRQVADIFRVASERKDSRLLAPLESAVHQTYNCAMKYYRANCGRGEGRLDAASFFRHKRGRNKELRVYLNRTIKKDLKAFEKRWMRVEKALAVLEAEA